MRKVSIVIPLYKSATFLDKLLNSIINQTYNNLEVILIDDGSPDNSGEIADKYSVNDKRIRVLHQKNQGCCEARNRGIEIATGDYLMFADGDDWMEPDCVEYLVTLAEKNNCEMATTDAIFTTRDRVQNECDYVRVLNKEDAVAGLINTFYIPVGPWNKIYTMRIVKEHQINFSVPWFGEGLYFSVMNAQYSNKMALGHRKVYNYRLNNPNSGCTVKEVQNGINSLWNIMNIKEKLNVKSRKIDEALSWHIWMNNYGLMCYIMNSNSIDRYKDAYYSSAKALQKELPMIFRHSQLNISTKLKILAKTIYPSFFINRSNKIAKREFDNDIME